MLNEKRVKHMTRLASYDEKSGEQDLKINSYFKKTYVRFIVVGDIRIRSAGWYYRLILYGNYYGEPDPFDVGYVRWFFCDRLFYYNNYCCLCYKWFL